MDSERSTHLTFSGTYEILTSLQPAAIAVLRIHGVAVTDFLARHVRTSRPLAPNCPAAGSVLRGQLLDARGEMLDDILISVHAPGPHWDLRLHLHGSPWLLRDCAALLETCGLVERHAPVDLWPCRDALEAEAYSLLPKMLTLRGAQWLPRQAARLRGALDDLLEETSLPKAQAVCRDLVAGPRVVDWFTQPLRVAIVGPPNSGKSTLVNTLADQTVSLVSPQAGTTRDWVEVPGLIRGFPVTWLDTAGLKRGGDELEAAAIARTAAVMRTAGAVVVVLDSALPAAAIRNEFLQSHHDIEPACVVMNKADLGRDTIARELLPRHWQANVISISTVQGTGLDAFGECLTEALGRSDDLLERPGAFTARQLCLLKQASEAPDRPALSDAIRVCLHQTPES
ncbi:MAG: GTPase [Planctomycetota bacterium]